MTGQDIVLILGAYSAFVLAAFGLLIKFAVDSRKTGDATNRAVNDTNRAVNHTQPGAPTVRELIEDVHADMRELRREGNVRHSQNIGRIDAVDKRLRTVEADLKTHMRDLKGDQ